MGTYTCILYLLLFIRCSMNNLNTNNDITLQVFAVVTTHGVLCTHALRTCTRVLTIPYEHFCTYSGLKCLFNHIAVSYLYLSLYRCYLQVSSATKTTSLLAWGGIKNYLVYGQP